MNFFDAAYEPATSSTPPSPPAEPGHHRQQSLNEEVTEVIGQLGRFWGGFRKQSETALQAARKDLGGYVLQAQREFNKLSVTPENVTAGPSTSRDAPSTSEEDASASYSSTSTSASASTSTLTGNEQQPAPQGLLSRLQSSIPPDLLATVQNTQNTLSETLRHAPERVDLSQLRSTFGNELQRMRVHSAAARGEELLRGAGDLLREAVRVVPPDAAGGSGSGTTGVMWDGTDVWTMPGLSGSETPQSDSPVVGKERSLRRSGEVTAIATRKEALLRALRTNPEILKVDPTVEHRSSQMFETWVKAEVEEKEGGLLGMEWNARIEKEMEIDGTALKDMKDALVASEMTEDIFWTRYFFRVYQIEQEEIRRKALLQGPVEQEDEFSWEDDDEASSPTTTRPPPEEGQETSAETLTSSTAIPPPSPDKLSAPSPQSLTPGHASATGGAKEREEEGDESGSDWDASSFRHDDFLFADIFYLLHILLIADPHVLSDTHVRAHTLSQYVRDLHLHKSWTVARRLHPRAIFFLGDILASGGAINDDDEYDLYVRKFNDTFNIKSEIDVKYLPGNGDVGMGVSNSFTKHVRERYTNYFGPVNQLLSIANHTLVLLDAPGLVNEDYLRAGRGVTFEHWTPSTDGPIEFVKAVAAGNFACVLLHPISRLSGPDQASVENRRDPVILFSHIPLHRAESRSCGPLREKGTIRRGVGRGWQNTLGKQTSNFLLESLKPAIIFSANDRDYCDITHTLPVSPPLNSTDINRPELHEITVKSFSLVPQITRPGFQLLSLLPADEVTIERSPTFAHTPCLLPALHGTLTGLYLPLFLFTVIVLLMMHIRRAHRWLFSPSALSASQPYIAHVLPVPTPQPSKYLYAYSNTQVSQGGQTTPSYFERPAVQHANGARGEVGGPKTPRTPWAHWSPVPPPSGLAPFLAPSVDGASDDVEKTPRTPTLRTPVMTSSTIGRLLSPRGGVLRDEVGEVGPEDKDDEDCIYVGKKTQENGLGFGPVGVESTRVDKGEDKDRRCGWAYVFSFRGQRRKVVLRCPPWMQAVGRFLFLPRIFEYWIKRGSERRIARARRAKGKKKPLWIVIGRDMVRVVWPAAVVWAGITWIFIR
ncbi:hypothetical protein EW146_g4360 [Bondarzewia mesenterica]|uniref:BSD domain-containing protein n=1 Tax=Bondarzewia mesenterica TaxID=1095465 RepID=A0A4S4LUR7_9AGAM|nr:hypothetical protein EW146_g4360 [Bondarzewia mesenterica]